MPRMPDVTANPAPDLATVQSRVRDVVLGADATALHGIVADDRFGFARRLGVYRNNTTILLIEALAANFPVTQQLVGEDFFANLARGFLRRQPPHAPCLFEYGRDFPAHLDAHPQLADLPYLADVARLEWAWNEAFHAANAPALDASHLDSVAPGDYSRLTFTTHPALRLTASPYPIHAIWALHQPDADAGATVDLAQGGETVMITRPGSEVLVSPITPGTGAFVQALTNGETLGEAFIQAGQADPAFDGAAAIAQLLISGALCAFDLT